jgi:hypothetical protein
MGCFHRPQGAKVFLVLFFQKKNHFFVALKDGGRRFAFPPYKVGML